MKLKLMNMLKSVFREPKKREKLNAWRVYLGHKLIDTVFFEPHQTAWQVRRSLVYHDGYPGNIKVVCVTE